MIVDNGKQILAGLLTGNIVPNVNFWLIGLSLDNTPVSSSDTLFTTWDVGATTSVNEDDFHLLNCSFTGGWNNDGYYQHDETYRIELIFNHPVYGGMLFAAANVPRIRHVGGEYVSFINHIIQV